MDTKQIVIFVLAAVAAGGTIYVLAYPWLNDDRAEKRQKSIHDGRAIRSPVNPRETALRRGQVSDSLKDLERRQKNLRNPPLTVRLEQAGLSMTPKKYYIGSAIFGVVLALVLLVATSWYIAAVALFVGTFGLPRWFLKQMTKRRQAKFIKEFPNAIDIIVRGVKSGLPLGDCFRIVASEAQEPVKTEFRSILEMQTVGLPLGEAVDRLYARLGLSEANFFSIVIAIQSKSGGNLSEALGNLAHVLRERQKMRGKIQAMSMEAKASAWIIGSLPIVVGSLVYFANPDYIAALWQKNLGLVLLGASALWMTCGVLTMRKMINFDF
jgi:tight adherence protein B